MKFLIKQPKTIPTHPIPLSIQHARPSTLKIALSRIAIVLTILSWVAYITSTILRQFIDSRVSYHFTMEAFGYALVVSVFIFSALIYLITRQGALERFSKHVRVPRSILDKYFGLNRPKLTVLIPSYSEEPQVIRKTILSAALQEYPDIRIVLLLDDKPFPTNAQAAVKLEATRALKQEITAFLSEPYRRFKQAMLEFEKETTGAKFIPVKVTNQLAANYSWAAAWLSQAADRETVEDHVDVFFADQVLKGLAKELELVAEALTMSGNEGVQLSKDRVHQLYRRLVWIFGAEIEIFERKKYASLSHEANKAMNLNSYIGLMGGRYKEEQTPDGPILTPTTGNRSGTINIPDSEFLLTLDADSILLRDYCLRLVYFLLQPDHARVAVTQTPYSAFRGAPSPLERLSGATTDIQHILHQGMSQYNATFWVGANAVIRKKALEDIVEKEWIGGFEIKRFIQDRTVIEDTESSIDLAIHGWKLVNYPERLSYSATPSDFGSLIVQRRRWANGGLLILPKLWSQIRQGKNKNEIISPTETMIRLNYMASIAWSSFGLLFMLAYPYDGRLLSPLVVLAAFPYYIAMACDLKYCGYKYSDIFRIYGFNLILLPVNLAGVFKSFEQALTGKKIPFARTPKIKNRTAASLPYVVAPLLIVGFSLFTLWRNIEEQNWVNASVAAFNAFAATWAIVAYIGIINLLVDIWLGLTSWLYVESKPKTVERPAEDKPLLNWKAVLYHGEETGVVPYNSLNGLMLDKGNSAKRQVLP